MTGSPPGGRATSEARYTLRDYARSVWWRLLLTAAFIYIAVEGTADTLFWAISIGLGAMWSHDLWKTARARRPRKASGG